MPRNLELKAALPDFARAVRTASMHARRAGVLLQTDYYFRTRNGRLKLRRFNSTRGELIGYERKEGGGDRWSDYFVLPVAKPDEVVRTLTLILGLRAVVKKRRTLYRYRNARIHLDRVAGIGDFIEFEVLVTRGERQAKQLLAELKEMFRIPPSGIFRKSYVDLQLRRRRSRARAIA